MCKRSRNRPLRLTAYSALFDTRIAAVNQIFISGAGPRQTREVAPFLGQPFCIAGEVHHRYVTARVPKIGMIEEGDQFAIWRDRGICDVARVLWKGWFSRSDIPDGILHLPNVNRSQRSSVLAPGSLQHVAQQFARRSSVNGTTESMPRGTILLSVFWRIAISPLEEMLRTRCP